MVGDVQVPAERQSLDFHGADQALPQSGKNHAMGQDRDAQIVDGGVHQCRGTHGFPSRDNVEARLLRHPVKDFPGTAPLFPQEKPLILKFFQRDDLSLFPAFSLRTYHAQNILHIGFGDNVRIGGDPFDQR